MESKRLLLPDSNTQRYIYNLEGYLRNAMHFLGNNTLPNN
jgi:hypothetical protein